MQTRVVRKLYHHARHHLVFSRPRGSTFGADLRNECFVYRCGCIIGHFTAHGRVGYCFLGSFVYLIAFLVTLERWAERCVADCIAFSRVITNKL